IPFAARIDRTSKITWSREGSDPIFPNSASVPKFLRQGDGLQIPRASAGAQQDCSGCLIHLVELLDSLWSDCGISRNVLESLYDLIRNARDIRWCRNRLVAVQIVHG